MSTSTVKKSSGYRIWQDRIAGGVITSPQASQFVNAIKRPAVGLEPRGKRTNIILSEARELNREVRDGRGMTVDAESTEKGLAWLRNNAKILPTYGEDSFPLEHVLSNFSHFLFFGGCAYYGERTTVPVWSIILTTGEQFDYWRVPWQAQVWNDDTNEPTAGWSRATES